MIIDPIGCIHLAVEQVMEVHDTAIRLYGGMQCLCDNVTATLRKLLH